MVLEALIDQLVQRFQHEKRARVCLWFDERQEFSRLLPALRAHLGRCKEAPFLLFEYDPKAGRGQVWLKRQIYRVLENADAASRASLRFVLYLPMSEERLETPGTDGVPALELLTEYRIAGITWRIGGKRPTLFAFLRQAGVALPDGPSEQRRLYEGGGDSVLAKYATKFAERPPVFWTTTLTPELAQSRLIGDVDETILEVANDPQGAWSELRDKGLDREFCEIVRERYGFTGAEDSPADWIAELVTMLALTETYLEYGEPADFPFIERLPPLALRAHHGQLLRRWLRDLEARAAYDRWIEQVESRVDLTSWAKGRRGASFAFPHLVRLRWKEVLAEFDAAAPKASAVAKFFVDHGSLIANEAEYARTSPRQLGGWELLRRLGELVDSCDLGRRHAESVDTVRDLAAVYVEHAALADGAHVAVRYGAEEQGIPSVTRVADRVYADYTNTLNQAFFDCVSSTGTTEIAGVEPVSARLEEAIWRSTGKRAVVIVDALRFDCALAIKNLLRDQQVDVEPLLATLPTITAVGMTALLPLSGANVSLRIESNSVHPMVNGKDTSVSANRRAYLAEHGADCREISDLESVSDSPSDLGDLLVVFGHDAVDHIGHGDAQTLIRHMNLEIERLARLIRKLHRWGYPNVHVVTDHGFILLEEEKLPPEVPCKREWCYVRKERFALVSATAELPLVTFPCVWDASVRVAVPPGLAFFIAEKSFSHGGATLQELIIPHLLSKSHAMQERSVEIEVVLPTFELMRSAVKVVLRARPAIAAQAGQLGLFALKGRTLKLDVTCPDASGKLGSVLATGPREIRLEPNEEQSISLFFHTTLSLRKGDLLALEIKDAITGEPFPPGGITLTAGRDM